jgi:hypothetical protein
MAEQRVGKRQTPKIPAPLQIPVAPAARFDPGIPAHLQKFNQQPERPFQEELGAAMSQAAGVYTDTARKMGKSRDPDYKRVMVLLRKDTEKYAGRKWEDAEPDKDFSDLVELLLSEYVAGRVNI